MNAAISCRYFLALLLALVLALLSGAVLGGNILSDAEAVFLDCDIRSVDTGIRTISNTEYPENRRPMDIKVNKIVCETLTEILWTKWRKGPYFAPDVPVVTTLGMQSIELYQRTPVYRNYMGKKQLGFSDEQETMLNAHRTLSAVFPMQISGDPVLFRAMMMAEQLIFDVSDPQPELKHIIKIHVHGNTAQGETVEKRGIGDLKVDVVAVSAFKSFNVWRNAQEQHVDCSDMKRKKKCHLDEEVGSELLPTKDAGSTLSYLETQINHRLLYALTPQYLETRARLIREGFPVENEYGY